MLAALNALMFTAHTAIPLPSDDAWYFIDTFVRKAVGGQLHLADFFAQRGPSDHSQPLHRLVLLAHMGMADLDFRVEALIGVVLGVITCTILAFSLVAGSGDGSQRQRAWLGAAVIFAVGLSLNATNIYTWSLVSLIWISLLAVVGYWILAAQQFGERRFLVLMTLATFAMASVLDELAFPTLAAAIVALLVRDGVRRPRSALMLVLAGGVGLFAGRWFIHRMANAAADATGASVSQLLDVLRSPGAWKLLVAPLSDSLVHREHLEAWFPTSMVAVQVLIALVLVALHACFWWRALFGADRPRDKVLVLAVASMLFFYACIAGIVLSRVTEHGIDYIHQPRYTAVYQLNVIALVLMFLAPSARLDAEPKAWPRMLSVVLATAVLVLQLPLTADGWHRAKFVRDYTRNAAKVMAEVGGHPGIDPTPSCPNILLAICTAPADARERTFALLRTHGLNIYSARFRRANDLVALSLPQASAAAVPKPAAPRGSCDVAILRRDPVRILPGRPFYPQPDGHSAFWLMVAPETPRFDIEFEGQRLDIKRRGGRITYLHDDRQVAAAAAGRPLQFDVICAGKRVTSFDVQVR
ncbi:hypothetical protein [Lysobacter fragariae]